MLILECSRADYWGTAFIIPLVSVAFAVVLLLFSVRNLILSFRDGEPLGKQILRTVSCLITFVFLFGVHFPTFRYGVFLPTVSETDAQSRQGFVSNVAEVPFSPRFSIQNGTETYRASYVWIDGDVYYFLNAEGLEIGNEIVISYLPRCNMVLSCHVVEK